ncbi:GTP cyclohydrolase 1 type 2 homolog YbgI [hydrothermal vent metagenome]|uniref:GTP cyclohydrolase 1 type 2 homolog YbgI n=1 Tax=hydrothermal vent metagenome TaxID=652676 RepID=A0A3B1CAX2_9ZZZZ
MADLHEIVAFANDLLMVSDFKDYSPNGLQVEGKKNVSRVVTGVSACLELFEMAVKKNADAVIVHHGMFWDSDPRVVRGSFKARLKLLLENEISLLGYHLPLDRNPEIGNNIQLVKTMGLLDPVPFGIYAGKSISYIGSFNPPVATCDFMEIVKNKIWDKARHYDFGAEKISRVALCSGSAPELLREAISAGADAYVTGEDTEWVYHLAREEKIHYIVAGHHATERFGIKKLGEKIGDKFGVEVEFVDIPNPI